MKTSGSFKPFRHLKALFEQNEITLESARPCPLPDLKDAPADERNLFKKAMEGVRPLERRHRRSRALSRRAVEIQKKHYESEDQRVVKRLEALVRNGTGFAWSSTSEYVEGTGTRVHPEIARRLHNGEFTVQTHIDLHGLTLREARDVFDRFMAEAVRTRKNAVLIVHGRGLSSPNEPVLKAGVVKWLSRSPWRKWIAAFTSARTCDGGAGATYVLFRPTPVSRSARKG